MKLEGIVVVPTSILSDDWDYEADDKWVAIDFEQMKACFFKCEPTAQQVANANIWWDLEPLNDEDKKAIEKYLAKHMG